MRTHTSPVQAHTLLAAKGKGPIKVICPGKTYRRDDDDATHSHQFMQCEGLVVDKNITLADLKGTLEVFARKFFGEKREIRLRPSYFPFTEPSVEVDISCHHCGGKGCAMCKGTGWIEILGAGMVNPKVLDMCGFDSKVYQGFAFGIGIERVAMLKYGSYAFVNGNWIQTIVPASNPNPDLKWEEKKETNIGLDFVSWGGRLSGSIDYYNRDVDGLIYEYGVPTPPNLYNKTMANGGTMRNLSLIHI